MCNTNLIIIPGEKGTVFSLIKPSIKKIISDSVWTRNSLLAMDWLRVTWPTGSHDDNDDNQEECKHWQANSKITTTIIETKLLGVAQQQALLLLPGWQLEVSVGCVVLVAGMDLVLSTVTLTRSILGGQAQRCLDHQGGLLQVMELFLDQSRIDGKTGESKGSCNLFHKTKLFPKNYFEF